MSLLRNIKQSNENEDLGVDCVPGENESDGSLIKAGEQKHVLLSFYRTFTVFRRVTFLRSAS